eukprot:771228-Amphidinium_carterae.1
MALVHMIPWHACEIVSVHHRGATLWSLQYAYPSKVAAPRLEWVVWAGPRARQNAWQSMARVCDSCSQIESHRPLHYNKRDRDKRFF